MTFSVADLNVLKGDMMRINKDAVVISNLSKDVFI
jgi:hypothetical protein